MPRPPRRPEGRTPTRPTAAPRPSGRKPRRAEGEAAPAGRSDPGKPDRPPRRKREDGPKAVYRPDPGGPPRAPRDETPRAARDDKPRAARDDKPRAARGDSPAPPAAMHPAPRAAKASAAPVPTHRARRAAMPSARHATMHSAHPAVSLPALPAAMPHAPPAAIHHAQPAATHHAPPSAMHPAPPEATLPRATRGAPPRHHAEPPAAPIDDTPPPPRPGAGAGSGAYWIYGHHAVLAALSNPRRKPRRLLTTTDAELALRDAYEGRWRVTPERADRARFATFLTEDAVHQGIALLAEPLEPVQLEDAIEAAPGPVLLLDQVTDPRNVGAALRAAAAFGAACVVLQDRHAPPETGTLARAASGALDIVPVVREVNLSRAIAALQRAGFWVIGLAGEGKRTLAEAAPRDRRVALVMGAEDSGLRRLQRETCDELVRLPMAEGVESLNVASAAAVALYEIIRR